jgi:hypothetical protein
MNHLQALPASMCLALSVVGPFVDFAAGQDARSTEQPALLLSPAEFPDYDGDVWEAAAKRACRQARITSTRRATGEPGNYRVVAAEPNRRSPAQGIWVSKGLVNRWIA